MPTFGFALRDGSKFHSPSAVQQEAMDAIRDAGSQSGIVVLPCGTGKTSVFLHAALEAGRKVLFLCYEKQGVIQVAETIREHSTVHEDHVCVYTSDIKKRPNRLMCYMVTTYGMFSSANATRSETTKDIRDWVMNGAKWDLVVLDETHHAAASTYRPFVERLQANAKRVLGFTGTLCRNDHGPVGDGEAPEARAQHMASLFRFIGPVLYSRTCRELEQEGLIARVRRMEVQTELTDTFDAALRATTNGVSKKYVESLHPQKLNALWMLVSMHVKMGDVGMIFVNHLLHAKVVQELLGDKWEILSGSNAHGDDGTHSAEDNAKIVARFNGGELRGIVSTPVGESALDAINPDFRYAIVVDAHSGPASASQKLGRLSRTQRVDRRASESDEDHLQRRMDAQKKASYYEIVTLGTEEMTAAANRHAQFEHEGYRHRTLSYASLRGANPDASLPYETETEQARLLLRALTYSDLGVAAKIGADAASAVRKTHQKTVKEAEKKSKEAKNKLFQDKHRRQHNRLKKQSGSVNAKAKAIRKEMIDTAPVSLAVRAVLVQIRIKPSILKELNVELGNVEEPEPDSSDGEDEPEPEPEPARVAKNWRDMVPSDEEEN